jgi:hypothetical protein
MVYKKHHHTNNDLKKSLTADSLFDLIHSL